MARLGDERRWRSRIWLGLGLVGLLVIFLAQELAGGLLPDVYKNLVGDSPERVAGGAVGALTIAGIMMWAIHRRAEREADASRVEEDAARLARSRQILLQAVKLQWIEGRDSTWENAVRVELRLVEQPAAVADPWASSTLAEWRAPRPLPQGAQLRDRFAERYGSQLVILGEPGAGKTTQLLELTRSLVTAAENDPSAPVPVVLLLSTWTRGSLEEWIASELRDRYRVSIPCARGHLSENQITLILDGLDEVATENRQQCVKEINRLLSADGLPGIGVAVSCRTSDYSALGERLTVGGAVEVQPLAPADVHQLLRTGGGSLADLYRAASTDPALTQLLNTPLMLGVAVLAFSGRSDISRVAGSADEQRAAIFDAYIERMMTRDRSLRGRVIAHQDFPTVAFRRKLIWLAGSMKNYGITTVFPHDPIPLANDELRLRMSNYGRLRRLLANVLIRRFLYFLLKFPREDFFLYATERAIMRARGGGYQFLHRALLEHLASQSASHSPSPYAAV